MRRALGSGDLPLPGVAPWRGPVRVFALSALMIVGVVDVGDLLAVMAAVGRDTSRADINRDNVVDSADLVVLLADMGMGEEFESPGMDEQPAPLFGLPRGQICVGAAAAGFAFLRHYVLFCRAGLLVSPLCNPAVGSYLFLGTLAVVSTTCLIDLVF